MPVYRIERQLQDMSEDEAAAAGYRAVQCLKRFPDLRWLHSYLDPRTQHLTCYYETDQMEQIWQHAEMAAIPCDLVTEVVEFRPDDYL